jgi:hypothetical protein
LLLQQHKTFNLGIQLGELYLAFNKSVVQRHEASYSSNSWETFTICFAYTEEFLSIQDKSPLETATETLEHDTETYSESLEDS